MFSIYKQRIIDRENKIEKQKKELDEHIKEKREQLCHKGHDRVQTWMRSLNQEDAKAIADGAIRQSVIVAEV